MLPFARPSVFHLTSSTPSPVSYDQDISPKHTLNIHDLDGQGREWTIDASVSKVSIYNSKNLTLRLQGRVISSTVDVWQCSNLVLVIATPSRLGTVQLDPTLDNVTVRYHDPALIGKIVLAPRKSDESRDYGFKNLKFEVGSTADPAPKAFVLADTSGNLHDPDRQEPALLASEGEDRSNETAGGQWVLSFDESEAGREPGWRLAGLERGANDYPLL